MLPGTKNRHRRSWERNATPKDTEQENHDGPQEQIVHIDEE